MHTCYTIYIYIYIYTYVLCFCDNIISNDVIINKLSGLNEAANLYVYNACVVVCVCLYVCVYNACVCVCLYVCVYMCE